jgi:lysophospholipase L1-like esterase
MQLTHTQLHAYAVGLSSSSTLDGAWHPLRIPDSMVPLYEKTPAFKTRMHCPSCVRIRFTSNTRSLKLTLQFSTRAREIFKSALIVDGQPALSFGPESFAPTWASEIFHQTTPASHIFDLWLPHMAQADILALSIDDDATLSPAPPLTLRWLAYGDSITQGMTAPIPTQTAIARTALALNANVLNLGIGGAQLDEELHQTIPHESYDIVSIAYGTNDFLHIPLQTFSSRARLLVSALTQAQPKRPIILITPLTWVGQNTVNKFGTTLQDLRNSLAPIATEFPNVTLLHGDQAIPHDDQYFVDKVHPNAAGFQLYATALTNALQSCAPTRL